jgi:hypothetical protein
MRERRFRANKESPSRRQRGKSWEEKKSALFRAT